MRLIDAELLKRTTERLIKEEEQNGFYPKSWDEEVIAFKYLIDSMPTTEAKPVVRAHWIYDGEDDWSGNSSWYCSKCSSFIETEEDTLSCGYNFCPCCGAQMDENHIAEGGKKENEENGNI